MEGRARVRVLASLQGKGSGVFFVVVTGEEREKKLGLGLGLGFLLQLRNLIKWVQVYRAFSPLSSLLCSVPLPLLLFLVAPFPNSIRL